MTMHDRSPTHHIRQVVFDLRYQDEATALRGRKQMEEAFYRAILPLLEEAFDTHAPNGQHYHLDRLEIDLGRINPNRLDEAHIRRALVEALGSQVRARPAAATGEPALATQLEETLVHFLEVGYWPWHATPQRVAEVEVTVLALPPVEGRRLAQRLRPRLQRRPVRMRLVYQFSTRFLRWLVEQLRPEVAGEVQQAAEHVLSALSASERWAIILAVVVALSPAGDATTAELEQRLRTAQGEPPLPSAEDGSVSNFTQQQVSLLPAEQDEVLPAAPAQTVWSRDPQERTDQAAEGLYVLHAGIVLLHPFLDRFFRRLGLAADGQTLATLDQRVRAVHLLHYLATGQEQPEEHETPLLKLLCALPLTFPLVKMLPLTQTERDEAETLLEAVIEHWAKLKNTSPAALRETFFQREGKLAQRDDRWHLVVEQRTVDLLLDYLPWTLSIVRLPWMASPLWVDWA